MRLLRLYNCCGAANRKLQRCITIRIRTAKGDGCPSPFVQSAEKKPDGFLACYAPPEPFAGRLDDSFKRKGFVTEYFLSGRAAFRACALG